MLLDSNPEVTMIYELSEQGLLFVNQLFPTKLPTGTLNHQTIIIRLIICASTSCWLLLGIYAFASISIDSQISGSRRKI